MNKEGITFYTVPKGYGKTYEALLNREKYLSKELEKFVKLYEKTKQENQQLKEQLENASKNYTKYIQQRDNVLDEIRKYTEIGINTYKNGGSRTALFEVFDTINEILEEVENESNRFIK